MGTHLYQGLCSRFILFESWKSSISVKKTEKNSLEHSPDMLSHDAGEMHKPSVGLSFKIEII